MGRDIYGRKDELQSVSQPSSAHLVLSPEPLRIFTHTGPRDSERLEGVSGYEAVPLELKTSFKVSRWGDMGAG